jgi:uncharacterized membrane protein HdeD (DUF308 family)
MSLDSSLERGAVTAIRTALAVSGALSLVVGLLIFFWPGRTAEVAVGIVAIWAIVAGLIYAGMGILSRSLRGASRLGHIALGVLFVVAGVIALVNLAAATAGFALFLGIIVGVLWIVEGVVAFATLGGTGSKGWSIFFAVISILAGVVLLFTPLYVGLLWVFLGAALIVLGLTQIVRAFTFGRRAA